MYIHWKLYKNTFHPYIFYIVSMIETLGTVEFKSAIIEFNCFKAPQLYKEDNKRRQ